jgi:hypothetical protein
MFRGSRIDRRILLAPALSALISLSASAVTFPPGFNDNLVATVGAPTALAFTSDGGCDYANDSGCAGANDFTGRWR